MQVPTRYITTRRYREADEMKAQCACGKLVKANYKQVTRCHDCGAKILIYKKNTLSKEKAHKLLQDYKQ